MEDLKINVVYTPGSVRYLRLFVFSLLKWLDCSFRLVANGCSEEEALLLRELCSRDPRLEFVRLPFHHVVRHWEALDCLQRAEGSGRFCFMDSDIYATGDFLGELLPSLGEYTAVFSGFPLFMNRQEQELPPGASQLLGRYNRSREGICLGSTYFAVYDNRKLSRVMEDTGVSFGQRPWADVPEQCHGVLTQMGLRADWYDTGKLLNILLQARGEKLALVEASHLQHIGGFSFSAAGFEWRLKRLLNHRIGPVSPTQRQRREDMLRMRDIGRYFYRLICALSDNRRLPSLPETGIPEVARRIEQVTNDILMLHEEFGDQLSGSRRSSAC